ncbi:MAG: SMC family ATPase [Desulfuromonadales bacterium]|nr:SMC family ATPase [Desulfuromonadales bacterium]
MRPLKLTLRAFGPFVGEEVVDFTLYGDNAFLLINGPTGAGKTTLLDGICYALYGEASGAGRSEHYLRSQRAAKEVICQVDFLFSVGPRTYSLKRRPAQTILHKEKVRELNHQVEFCEVAADGEIIGERLSKINEVRERIESLLGFSSDQFRQVVVLPQGEFRRLLLAKSDEKERILEKLFNTGRYKFVEEALKKRRSLLGADLNRLKAEVEGIFTACQVTNAIELDERMSAVATRRTERALALETLTLRQQLCHEQLRGAQADAENFQEHDQSQLVFARLDQQKEVMARKATEVEAATRSLLLVDLESAVQRGEGEVTELRRRIAELSSAQLLLVDEVAAARQRVSACREEQGQITARVAEATQLQQVLTRLRELEGYRQELEKGLAAAAAAQQQYETLQEVRRREEEGIEALTARIEELTVSSGRLGEIDGEIGRVTQLLKVRREFDAESLRLQQLNSELATATAAVKVAEDAAAVARLEMESLQQKFIAGQAAHLAAQLIDGEPCLVCGASSHPQPARSTGVIPTEKELEGAAQRSTAAVAKVAAATAQQAELSGRQQGSTASRERLADALQGAGHDSLEKLQQRLLDLEQERALCTRAGKELEQFRQERLARNARRQEYLQQEPALIQALQAGTASVERLRGLVANSETATAGMQAAEVAARIAASEAFVVRVSREGQQAEAQLAELFAAQEKNRGEGELSEAQLQSRGTALVVLQAEFTDRLAIAGFADLAACRAARLDPVVLSRRQEELERFRQDLTAATLRLERAAALCAGRVRPDLAALQQGKEAIDAEVGALQQELGTLSGEATALAVAREKIGAKGDEIARLEEDYAVVGRLADLAGGQNPQRMTLQRYVLAALFEEVAIAASRRLSKMSRGRYHLLRAEIPRDGKSTGGLDLDVIDDYCGERRPAFTLSGGESFLASLALALGLSDVVLAQSGGRYLDCIFIDEGFGTLDGETLDFALNTLIELHQAGRVIGIISHVAELKERIPCRIEIVSQKEGSRIVQSDGVGNTTTFAH